VTVTSLNEICYMEIVCECMRTHTNAVHARTHALSRSLHCQNEIKNWYKHGLLGTKIHIGFHILVRVF